MFNYKNLTPFQLFCCNNFPFIEETFDDLTRYKMLCKIVGYLQDKIIPAIDDIGNSQNEIIQSFNELKSYVDNYFTDLNIQNEINNKLDEMAENGELANLITNFINLNPIITFKNIQELKNAEFLVNNNIVLCMGYYNLNDGGKNYYLITNEKTTNKDIELKNNLYATPLNKINNTSTKLTINLWLQWDITKIKQCIDSYVFMGVSNIILPLHLTGDTCELTENIDTINQAISYCKENGLNVNTIKFHCTNSKIDSDTDFQSIYQNKISEILTTLNAKNIGITRLIILNERNKLYNRLANETQLNFVKSIVTYFKNSGYLVSISMSTLKQGLIECINVNPDITDMLDFLCFNDYPIIGDYGKATTEKDSVEVFGNYENLIRYVKMKYPSKKLIWSEIGVQNAYESFSNPANYRIIDNPNSTPANGNTIPIYFGGLLNNHNMINLIDEIALWYTEYYYNYYDKLTIFRNYFNRKEV